MFFIGTNVDQWYPFRRLLSIEKFARAERVPYNAPRMAMRKEERIGVRVPAELKKALIQIAKAEDRSLAQVCEIFLRGGALSYKEEGPKFFQRLLTRQRGETEE
jgi:hypothetical protein